MQECWSSGTDRYAPTLGENLLVKSYHQQGVATSPRQSTEVMAMDRVTAVPHLGAFSESKEVVTDGTTRIRNVQPWDVCLGHREPPRPMLPLYLSGRDLVIVRNSKLFAAPTPAGSCCTRRWHHLSAVPRHAFRRSTRSSAETGWRCAVSVNGNVGWIGFLLSPKSYPV